MAIWTNVQNSRHNGIKRVHQMAPRYRIRRPGQTDPYRRRPQIFNGARPSSTCARVATHIAAKNADHFTGHIAAFGADRAANAEGVEIESGVDLAGFGVSLLDITARVPCWR